MPEVSVIIPVYNTEKYLAECLESVRNQTFKDFEVLCVNDGSIDSCAEILDNFCKKDSRFKHIKQKNQGVAVARNTALELAQGKYIYFTDSDDILHSQLITTALYFIEKYTADFVSFRFSRFADNKKAVEKVFALENIKFKQVTNPVEHIWTKRSRNPFKLKEYPWSKFIRKDFLGSLRFQPGIIFEDVPFSIKLLKNSKNAVLIDQKMYFYRRNPNSITENFNLKSVIDRQRGLIDILEFYQGDPNEHKLKKKLPRHVITQFKHIDKHIPFFRRGVYYRAFELGLIDMQPYGFLSRKYFQRRYLYTFFVMTLRRKLILFFQKLINIFKHKVNHLTIE